MKNRMQENIKNNPILGNPSRNIMEVNEEVIRLQNEASKNPEHWINDGLRQYFEERKQKLENLKTPKDK